MGELWESLSSCCPPLLALTAVGSISLSGKDSKYTIMIVFMHWHFCKTIVLKLNLVTAQTTVESKQAMASKGKQRYMLFIWLYYLVYYVGFLLASLNLRLTVSYAIMHSRLSLEYHLRNHSESDFSLPVNCTNYQLCSCPALAISTKRMYVALHTRSGPWGAKLMLWGQEPTKWQWLICVNC